jgi:hypothetical protein
LSAPAFLPPPQRRLLYGIWTVLAVGLALWALPSPERWTQDRLGPPKVRLGPELAEIFLGGRVLEQAPESMVLELELAPAYVDTVPAEGREFSLGYQFRKGTTLLRHGLQPVRVAKAARVRFRLPNPERAHPSEVFLSLLP